MRGIAAARGSAQGRLPRSCGCITNEYMANKTALLTVRIDPALHAALKAMATEDGRSLSAQVVWMLSRQVAVVPRKASSRPTMGMFAEFEAPLLQEFREHRRAAAVALRAATKRRGRAA